MTTDPVASARSGSACWTAWPVPSCSFWTAYRTWSPSRAMTKSRPYPTTTMMSVTPASRTCSTACWIMGLPCSSCRTFGKSDCIRLPCPPQRITARRSRRSTLGRPFPLPLASSWRGAVLDQRECGAAVARRVVVDLVHQTAHDEDPIPAFPGLVEIRWDVRVRVEGGAAIADGQHHLRLVNVQAEGDLVA